MGTDRQTDKHPNTQTRRHIHIMTRTGLRAGPSEKLNTKTILVLQMQHSFLHTLITFCVSSPFCFFCTVYSIQFCLVLPLPECGGGVSVQCKLYSVQCTLYISHCPVSSIQCTVYIVQCIVYSVKCKVYSVQCTVYSVQCTVLWNSTCPWGWRG